MTNREWNRPTRHAFTLVEMLTVIVIIGILAGLITAAAIAARDAARRAMIRTEISQLEMALQKYKSENSEFPPDFAFVGESTARGAAARARVVNHVRKVWPRMLLTGNTDQQFQAFAMAVTNLDGTSYGSDHTEAAKRLNPASALTFWLGGMPIDGKPKGFHEDPSNPFKTGEPRTMPFFDFDTERLGTLNQFFPAKVQPQSPYVYFRAVKDNTTGNYEYGAADDSGAFGPASYIDPSNSSNVCVPYLENATTDPPTGPGDTRVWRAPETYQIISAGLDGVYSTDSSSPFRYSKILEHFTDGDYDNLASFAEGELEDEG